MQERLAGYFALLLYSAGAVGLIWLAVRFLLPWAAPFILAWCIAALLEAPVKFLVRHRWRRAVASALCTIMALALLVWGVGALLWEVFEKLGVLARELPELMEAVTQKLRELEETAQSHISSAPKGGAMFLEIAGDAMTDALASLPEKYRLVLTLHYIEEYAIAEIAKIIRKSPSAVKMRLMRGRKLLEEIYRKEYL